MNTTERGKYWYDRGYRLGRRGVEGMDWYRVWKQADEERYGYAQRFQSGYERGDAIRLGTDRVSRAS